MEMPRERQKLTFEKTSHAADDFPVQTQIAVAGPSAKPTHRCAPVDALGSCSLQLLTWPGSKIEELPAKHVRDCNHLGGDPLCLPEAPHAAGSSHSEGPVLRQSLAQSRRDQHCSSESYRDLMSRSDGTGA